MNTDNIFLFENTTLTLISQATVVWANIPSSHENFLIHIYVTHITGFEWHWNSNDFTHFDIFMTFSLFSKYKQI